MYYLSYKEKQQNEMQKWRTAWLTGERLGGGWGQRQILHFSLYGTLRSAYASNIAVCICDFLIKKRGGEKLERRGSALFPEKKPSVKGGNEGQSGVCTEKRDRAVSEAPPAGGSEAELEDEGAPTLGWGWGNTSVKRKRGKSNCKTQRLGHRGSGWAGEESGRGFPLA